jgi:hypothetical protein
VSDSQGTHLVANLSAINNLQFLRSRVNFPENILARFFILGLKDTLVFLKM